MLRLFFATILLACIPPCLCHAGDSGFLAFGPGFRETAPPQEVPDIFFRDAGGRDIMLRDYLETELKGHYVLLNLWATWCVPCVGEMPSLDRLQEIMKPYKFTVLALNLDREGNVTAPAFYRRNGLKNLKVFWAASSVPLRRLHARGIPTSLLINPEGREIGRIASNIDWTRPESVAYLKQMVNRLN